MLTRRNLLGSLVGAVAALFVPWPKVKPKTLCEVTAIETAGAAKDVACTIHWFELKPPYAGVMYLTPELIADAEAIRPFQEAQFKAAMKESFGIDA